MKLRVGILNLVSESFRYTISNHKKRIILCKCDCGKDHKVDKSHWKKENVKSCGCNRYKSLLGKSFGRLIVLEESEKKRFQSTGEKFWKCKCKCGNFKEIATTDLTKKKGTRSCGCLLKKFNQDLEKRRLNRIFSKFKSHAKKRNLKFDLSIEEVKSLINCPCFYCNSLKSNKMKMNAFAGEEETYIEYMGIDRKDSFLHYTTENTVPCCITCNTMKHRISFLDYLKRIKN